MIIYRTLVLSLLLLALGCFRQEVQVAEYHIPAMTTLQVQEDINSRLKGIRGVESVSGDIETQTITVAYLSSTIRKMNIEETIAFSGYDVNNRPANAQAKTKLEKGQK